MNPGGYNTPHPLHWTGQGTGGAGDQEEMLEEAERLQHTHPEGQRRLGPWRRLRARLRSRRAAR